jgi:hypothetical protein
MRLLLLLVATVCGCQCFVPVDEQGDGGSPRDGGATTDAGRTDGGLTDAGTPDAGASDAGQPDRDAGQECLTARDCAGPTWSSAWCATDAGFSCVANHCVSSCGDTAGRACVFDAGAECLDCAAAPPLCNADNCPLNAFSATVSSVECRVGFTPMLQPQDSLALVPIRGASCELSVSAPGRGLGQLYRARDYRPVGPSHSWFIRELGGWCMGDALPTGALRSTVACPRCTFVIEGL